MEKSDYPNHQNYDGAEFEIAGGVLKKYTGDEREVKIPQGVQTIGRNAFGYHLNLKKIFIPQSVTSVNLGAFWDCPDLENIAVDPENKNYSDRDGILFDKRQTALIYLPEARAEIPEGMTAIGDGALGYHKNFKSLTIPKGVTSVGMSAFAFCRQLERVVIPGSVTFIDGGAFGNCTRLESIELPDGVTSIGELTFKDCRSLKRIELPGGAKSIGNWAFAGCPELERIVIPGGVQTVGEMVFLGCKNLTVYCRAPSQPDGWHKDWNPNFCPVVWGYMGV